MSDHPPVVAVEHHTPIVWDTGDIEASVVRIPADLAAALVAAWADLGNVTKAKSADAGSYTYTYADLGDVLDTARPVLAAHDLALIQPVERSGNGPLRIATWIVHASGAVLRFMFETPGGGSAQAVGSSITYGRRYCGTAALGIATEGDDDDGRGATPPPAPSRPRTTTTRRPKARPDAPPEATTAGTGEAQRRTRHAMALFSDLGLGDRDDRLQVTSAILGRPVESWSDTTATEQHRVIDELLARQAERDDGRAWRLDRHDADAEVLDDLAGDLRRAQDEADEGEGRDRGGY